MIADLLKVVIVVVTGLIANKVVKQTTGKHIHEHLFDWYCRIRDQIQNWLHRNQQLKANRIAIMLLEKVDRGVVRSKKLADTVTLKIAAVSGRGRVRITKNDKVYQICTRTVPRREALKMFPQLNEQAALIEPIIN
jgi:hypothetical protein